MSVTNFLNASTMHLTPAARAWLSEESTENYAANFHGVGAGGRISTLRPTLHGWFTWVPQLDVCDQLGVPADLSPVFDAARKANCNYVLFDGDAECIPGVPRYDEDGVMFEQDDPDFIDPALRKFCVTLKETVFYTVEVLAEDDEEARNAAGEIWAESESPTVDFSGMSQGVTVDDCEPMEALANA